MKTGQTGLALTRCSSGELSPNEVLIEVPVFSKLLSLQNLGLSLAAVGPLHLLRSPSSVELPFSAFDPAANDPCVGMKLHACLCSSGIRP